jgi:hypothetical protein
MCGLALDSRFRFACSRDVAIVIQSRIDFDMQLDMRALESHFVPSRTSNEDFVVPRISIVDIFGIEDAKTLM